MDFLEPLWQALLPLLQLLLPVIIGFFVVPLTKYVKVITAWIATGLPAWIGGVVNIDGFPAAIQRVVVVLIAFVLTQLGMWLEIQIPTDLALFTSVEVSSTISAAIAMVIHTADKGKTKVQIPGPNLRTGV